MPIVTRNGKKRPETDPKRLWPLPVWSNNARRRFKRRQFEEYREPVVASLDPSSSTPALSVPDLSLNGATTSEEVSSSAQAPAKNLKTIQSIAWLPPLFTFSLWRARLRRIKSESRRPFTSPDSSDAPSLEFRRQCSPNRKSSCASQPSKPMTEPRMKA